MDAHLRRRQKMGGAPGAVSRPGLGDAAAA